MGTSNTSSSLDELKNLISKIPVVDNHAHNLLRAHGLKTGGLLAITSEASGDALEDTPTSLPHLRAAGQLRKLYDLSPDADWETILKKRSELLDQDADGLIKKCLDGTQTILIDDGFGDPNTIEPYAWHNKYTLSPCKRIVRIEQLAADILSSLHQQNKLPVGVAIADEEACNLAWVSFITTFEEAIMSSISDPEVVGFKSVVCYRTGLDVRPGRDIDVAEDGLRSFKRHFLPEAVARKFRVEAKGMNDALVISTCKLIAAGYREHDFAKPLQFHTGLGDNDISLLDSNPGCLQDLIKDFPTVPIVLLHSSYPYTREAGYLATVYKNVYLDIGEVFPMVSRDGQENILREAMELTPTSKLLWSTDAHMFPETYWLANVQGREAIEKVFCEYVEHEDLTVTQAIKAVKDILFENANYLYGLELKLGSESVLTERPKEVEHPKVEDIQQRRASEVSEPKRDDPGEPQLEEVQHPQLEQVQRPQSEEVQHPQLEEVQQTKADEFPTSDLEDRADRIYSRHKQPLEIYMIKWKMSGRFFDPQVLREASGAMTGTFNKVVHPAAKVNSSNDLEGMPNFARFVFIQWLDFLGQMRSRCLPVAEFQRLVNLGNPVSISRGNLGTLQNDHMTPVCNPVGSIGVEADLTTLRQMQDVGSIKDAATVMARFIDVDSMEGLDLCPRAALQRIVHTLKQDYHIELLVGFEIEITFCKRNTSAADADDVFSPLDTCHAWGTFTDEQYTASIPLMLSITTALQQIGIEVQQMHSEAGAGQYEFVLPPLPPVLAIDTLIQARQCIMQIAAAQGLRATCHPQPFPGIGTAAHAHISFNPSSPSSLAPEELENVEIPFMASVLEHLPALCAFTMPQRVSYGRVVDDSWTGGTWVAWGTQNREVPLRKSGDARWEVRCLDGCANMYLALHAVFGVGLHGIKSHTQMKWRDCPMNPTQLSSAEKERLGITTKLPSSLREAISAAEADEVLEQALSPGIVKHYISMKKAEQEMLHGMPEKERRVWLMERY